MSFAQELKDFVGSFETGYNLFPNKMEREEHEWRGEDREWQRSLQESQERRLTAAANREQAMFDVDYSPEAVETNRRYNQARTAQLEAETDPEEIASRRRSRESQSKLYEAQAATAEEELEAIKRRNRLIKDIARQKAGLPPLEDDEEPTSAVPVDKTSYRAGTAEGLASIRAKDRDLAIRTIIGEAGSEDFTGKQAVANVILNRHRSGRYGSSISDVVMAKRQFEPWSTRKAELLSYSPDSAEYREAADALAAAMEEDVTGGATHFLNPDIVRKRRGGSLPKWAQGEALTIGRHAFYAPEGRVADGSVGADRYAPDSAFAAIDSIDRGRNRAIKNILNFTAEAYGTTQETAVETPEQQMAMEDYLLGEGEGVVADDEDVDKAKKLVKDAVGEEAEGWSTAEENLYTLSAMWEVALAEGDIETANRMGAAILQNYRRSSSQWLAVAQAAADDGELDDATEAIVKAYAFIPDGREVDVKGDKEKGYTLEIKNIATGEVEFKDLLSPEQMYAQIMGFSPADFDRQILFAAGMDEQKTRDEVGPAFVAQFPQYEHFTIREVEEARLLEAAKRKSGGTGQGANVPSFEEFVGQEEEGGFRDRLLEVTRREQIDAETGKKVQGTDIETIMRSQGANDADIERWNQGVENVAYMATVGDPEAGIEGFTGDQRLLAEFLARAVTDIGNTAPIKWDLDQSGQGQAIYKDAIRIPITQDMFRYISAMRGEAARDNEAFTIEGSRSRIQEQATATQRRKRAVEADREYDRQRQGLQEEFGAVPGPSEYELGIPGMRIPPDRAVPIP